MQTTYLVLVFVTAVKVHVAALSSELGAVNVMTHLMMDN